MGLWQSVVDAIYPPGCAFCDAETETAGGLCGACWSKTRFLKGCVCDQCGAPLPGEDASLDLRCDDCLVVGRPWSRGRSALAYEGPARTMLLRLKHGDRLDLVAPAARWMAEAGRAIWPDAPLLVPVPNHWTRRVKRRYNQAALLARAIARQTGAEVAPRALVRTSQTALLDGKSPAARFEALDGVIAAHPTHGGVVAGRNVIVIDDVMTSGATLAAATEALIGASAQEVRVLALARVLKET
ncbi:comF family protein [Palleronia marisminoris]|uniref:DNA utilization protein GntX n=1 Tax=Palleronia marisminoris TaxID=315423 RepID=A0A1Y5SY46_9RHOB|nr:double zinc ribbon domain-containing protein [Palleronia marisminoris]SFH05121.1 comF family protein [Palleronia marisminoris]SLN50600.1 DNA utilization protein GntX [Palleronia marisminoris]